MAENWLGWSDRIKEFAPVIGLHKHHLFYPCPIESFFTEQTDLMIYFKILYDEIVFSCIREFRNCNLTEKIQWMLNPSINKKLTYLDRCGGDHDIKKSIDQQKNEKHHVYARGFLNETTGEAYIVYWFFYLENFVPQSMHDDQIAENLNDNPEKLWTHEGDWEGISLHFAHFQDSEPIEVIFSQHESPKKRQWKNANFQDGRILTIPAIGSHANYFESIRKKSVPKIPFIPYSEVASSDILIYPENDNPHNQISYSLEELDPVAKHLWLHFKGRWGKTSGEIGKAPTGPLMKRKTHFKLLADIAS